MTDTFYRIANDMIVIGSDAEFTDPFFNPCVLIEIGKIVDMPECEAMLHRANTQPGLAKVLEILRRRMMDGRRAMTEGELEENAELIRAALSAATPAKGETP